MNAVVIGVSITLVLVIFSFHRSLICSLKSLYFLQNQVRGLIQELSKGKCLQVLSFLLFIFLIKANCKPFFNLREGGKDQCVFVCTVLLHFVNNVCIYTCILKK